MMFNTAINKRSIAGKATYFLQSFNHNEFNQMVRANKMMFGKGNSSEMRAEGLRDVVSLVSSNMIYMQAGILISQLRRSYIQQLADEDNPNPVTAFEDGLYDYWKSQFCQ